MGPVTIRIYPTSHPQGFTVVEVMMAGFVVLVVAVAALKLQSANLTESATGRLRSGAAAVGTEEIERLRALPFDHVPVEAATRAVTVDRDRFVLTTTITWDAERVTGPALPRCTATTTGAL